MYSNITLVEKFRRGAYAPRFIIIILLFLTGCIKSVPESDKFKKIVITENIKLPLVVYLKKDNKYQQDKLRIYIEGDGFAWKSKSVPSNNPTPKSHSVLKMAFNDSYKDILYIARPCQYLKHEKSCKQKYWTYARFSEDIIETINFIIDSYKSDYKSIELIGYSGGANIAGIISAKRKDIVRYITIAGNLDHSAWSSYHKITPLYDSLNSANYLKIIKEVPQIHFYGEKDKVVPISLILRYKNMLKSDKAEFIAIKKQGHGKWERVWKYLVTTYLN